MNLHSIFFKFGVSLAMGILVGLQREYARHAGDKDISAGIRTFALMGLIGCAATMVADELGSAWPLVIILFLAGSWLAVKFAIETWRGEGGLTTEFSALLTILAGALVYLDHTALAIATVVAVTALLSLKLEMHRFVSNLSKDDIIATLKFAIITAIILPILPNKPFGPEPFRIFNPYTIWLLVVLISGLSFVGYILIKAMGPRRGIGVMGLLGGLASSTAVTLSLTQKSRSNPELSQSFTQGIIISWTVMYLRLLVISTAVNPGLFEKLVIPVCVGILSGLGYSLFLFIKERKKHKSDEISLVNPFELGPAIKFGILFSLILLVSKAAQIYLGDAGLYLASVVSGLADVDAIALSLAKMTGEPSNLNLDTAATAIIIASLSNTALKGGVAVTGSKELRNYILAGTILMIVLVLVVTFVF